MYGPEYFEGGLELWLVVGLIWLIVFVVLRIRYAVSGKTGDAEAITFRIVLGIIVGVFALFAIAMTSLFIANLIFLLFSLTTGKDLNELINLHRFLWVCLFILETVMMVLVWRRDKQREQSQTDN